MFVFLRGHINLTDETTFRDSLQDLSGTKAKLMTGRIQKTHLDGNLPKSRDGNLGGLSPGIPLLLGLLLAACGLPGYRGLTS